MKREPSISVVVPVYNGGGHLARCLDALLASTHDSEHEIILVDDASTDGGAASAHARGVRVLRLDARSGPAAARNLGARAARGGVLLFVDADVLVRRDTIARVAAHFRDETTAAVFGSYDDTPSEQNFVSQYKNLFHHFVHQQSGVQAATFWAGCGAVRREAFERVGGFDEKRYAQPSIEDIELGTRLRCAGCRILLDKELQVKHLKRWTLRSLLRADVLARALPWSKLILEQGGMPDDLNLRVRHRACAALTVAAAAMLPVLALASFSSALFSRAWLALPLAPLAVVFLLNRNLYAFFLRRRGARFAAGAFALHLLYYLYSSAAFAMCWSMHALGRGRKAAPARDAAGAYRCS